MIRKKFLFKRPPRPPEPAVREDQASPPKPNRHLFHYTTADGLVGLLKSNCIFASHYGFLNDKLEGKTLRDFLSPHFERELADFVPKLIRQGILKDAVLTENGPNYYQAEVKNLFNAFDRATDNVAPYFITSFCIHDPDTQEFANGLLSQWRAYGRGGFAIEFEEAAIDDLAAKEREAFAYQGVLTNQVRYRDFGDVVDPEKFNGWAATMFKVVLKEKQPTATWDLEAILGNKTTEDYAGAYLSNVPFLKNAAFEEEKEYRIAGLCNRHGVKDPDDNRPYKRVQFRTRADGRILPYIELFKNLHPHLPIKSVLVGPHPYQESQVSAAKFMLEQYSIEAEVRASAVPFRE